MCLLARGVKYLLHNNNNYYYYVLIQCIRARINVFVCVFPCAKQRSTESTCVLEFFKRERSDVITVDYYFARLIASLFDWNLR